MNYQVLLRPDAELDIQDAFEWYEQRQKGLGSEFVRMVDSCLSQIQKNPMAYPTIHREIRRVLLRRFPYGVFYLLEAERERIVVLACIHASRDPKRWKGLT